ncbi:hypothetical protein J4222_03945 [Candidatus Woesearchaeota archaeon]|nr:hypothetical protein [Candidatus Woesearchaeota archaeon]
MKSKIFLLFIGTLFLIAACTKTQNITSFEECAAAGYPVMESYPRQCRANGELFVEEMVELAWTGFIQCPDEKPEVCTADYRPVCALKDNGLRCIKAPCQSFDAVTMGNDCTACGDAEVFGYYPGECEYRRFVICEETEKGFNITKMAEEYGWDCVDICPGNYDEYYTQIGSTACIIHYGEEEISEWETCDRSSDSCNCVKAYETTDGHKSAEEVQVENAKFRCVPEEYAERLLFRGGQERLDENGEFSTIIA